MTQQMPPPGAGPQQQQTATVAQTPSAKAFVPTKPKIGEIVQTSTDTWTAWTGGQPDVNWDGLANGMPQTVAAEQRRPVSAGSAAEKKCHKLCSFGHTVDVT